MKTRLILLSITCLAALAFSQPPDTLWTRHLEGTYHPHLNAVAALSDGGALAVGNCCLNLHHTFFTSAYFARMDMLGTITWQYDLWGYWSEIGAASYDVKVLPDGGYIVGCASNWGPPCLQPTALRMQANGDTAWSAVMEPGYPWDTEDTLMAVCVGNHQAFGAVAHFLNTSQVMQVDSMGRILWQHSMPQALLVSISASPDSGFVVAGRPDFFIAKLGYTGDTLWTRSFQIGPYSECAKILTAQSGDMLMVGGSGEAIYHGTAAMVSAQGELLWSRHYDFSPAIVSVDRCAEGGYIMLSDRLVRINESGDTLWTQTLPCDTCEYKSVVQTADSGFVVAGNNSPYYSGGYLVKFAREGLTADSHFILHPSFFNLTAFPNPFNPGTALRFTMPNAARATVTVYDITGRMVRTLLDEMASSGEHRLVFDGASLPSGLYFARLDCGRRSATQKLLLLK